MKIGDKIGDKKIIGKSTVIDDAGARHELILEDRHGRTSRRPDVAMSAPSPEPGPVSVRLVDNGRLSLDAGQTENHLGITNKMPRLVVGVAWTTTARAVRALTPADRRAEVLFSYARLAHDHPRTSLRARLPRSLYRIGIDSAGYTSLRKTGALSFTVEDYLRAVELHDADYFFTIDYMCEPEVLKKTGLTVRDHQARTTANTMEIIDKRKSYAITGTFAPVVQGWTVEDYLAHIDELKSAGALKYATMLGIGTLCCRTREDDILRIIHAIRAAVPMKLHGFGVKLTALQYRLACDALFSVDSHSWAKTGWRRADEIRAQCAKASACKYKNCVNCATTIRVWMNRINEQAATKGAPEWARCGRLEAYTGGVL